MRVMDNIKTEIKNEIDITEDFELLDLIYQLLIIKRR